MFSNYDNATKPQTVSIEWQMETPLDETADRPDERDEGFWPSHDPKAAGYVYPENFDEQMQIAKERMAAFERGDWYYVGVVAKAIVHIPIGQGCFHIMTIRSAGLWGIESDCTDYLEEVYREEQSQLQNELEKLAKYILGEERAKEGLWRRDEALNKFAANGFKS